MQIANKRLNGFSYSPATFSRSRQPTSPDLDPIDNKSEVVISRFQGWARGTRLEHRGLHLAIRESPVQHSIEPHIKTAIQKWKICIYKNKQLKKVSYKMNFFIINNNKETSVFKAVLEIPQGQ